MWQTAGVARWSLDQASAESTNNAGCNWTLNRFSDTGTNLGAIFTANRSTGLITITGDPTAALGIATKQYVDKVAQGLDGKASCKVATTANIALSAAQTIDGVAVVAGDRVLVKNQTTAAQNGIYIVATGTWTRALDVDIWAELVAAYTFVEQGTAGGDNGYLCTVNSTGTLGTTDVTWVQFSSAGQVTAGAGLTKTGSQIDVGGTAGRIAVTADAIDIDTTYIGQPSITTVGTVTTGSWNAPVAIPSGTATFTGVVTLADDPITDLEAATKQYVDTALASAGIPDAPSDAFFYGRKDATWVKGLPLTGGKMVGTIELDTGASIISPVNATGGGLSITMTAASATAGSGLNGGAIAIDAGDGDGLGRSGSIEINAGGGATAGGGLVQIAGGTVWSAGTGPGGNLNLFSGGSSAPGQRGGTITIAAGDGDADGGKIILEPGSGTPNGIIEMRLLPAVAQTLATAVWNNNGVLNIGVGGSGGEFLPLAGGVMSGMITLDPEPGHCT